VPLDFLEEKEERENLERFNHANNRSAEIRELQEDREETVSPVSLARLDLRVKLAWPAHLVSPVLTAGRESLDLPDEMG